MAQRRVDSSHWVLLAVVPTCRLSKPTRRPALRGTTVEEVAVTFDCGVFVCRYYRYGTELLRRTFVSAELSQL